MGGGTSARNISHGRGGAGNIYTGEARTTAQDLVTPTIKQDIYTTGRGGSGNMMHYDPERPELARESQDVEAPPVRLEEAPHHTGRGGAANAYIPTAEEEKKAREEDEQLRRDLMAKAALQARDIEEGNANAHRERDRSASLG